MIIDRWLLAPVIVLEWGIVLGALKYVTMRPGGQRSAALSVLRVLGVAIVLATFFVFLWINRTLHGGRPGKLDTLLVIAMVGSHILLGAAMFWILKKPRSTG